MHRALAELMELGPDADETVYNTFLTERDGIVDAQREKALQKNRGKHGRAEPASAVGPSASWRMGTVLWRIWARWPKWPRSHLPSAASVLLRHAHPTPRPCWMFSTLLVLTVSVHVRHLIAGL